MKRRTIKQLRASKSALASVSRAHKREKSNRSGASGDVMDFALMVAEEARIAEMERVAPYLEEVEANLREMYLSSGVLGAPLRSGEEIILDALQKIQVVLLYPRSR